MEEANSIKIPADPHVKLVNANKPKLDFPYREDERILLAMVSHPDIAYTVGVASRFLDKHDISHWQAAKRILRYLKGTQNFGLLFRCERETDGLVEYSDTDYSTDLDTR